MLMPVDIQFHRESVRPNCSIVMQGVFGLAGQCICGLDDGRSGCNASTLQKSATGKRSLGTICHGNGLSEFYCEVVNQKAANRSRTQYPTLHPAVRIAPTGEKRTRKIGLYCQTTNPLLG